MRIFLSILLFVNAISAVAADIAFDDVTKAVYLTGKINAGDSKKLIKIVKESELITGLLVDSKGGDVIEAVKIAEIVKELRLYVQVRKDKVCASACFFLYVAGVGRHASGIELKDYDVSTGFIAIHRPYLNVPKRNEKSMDTQLDIMQIVSKFLERQMVPRRLIDLMMRHSSNDAYWLTIDDIDELGDYSPDLEELYIAECKYDGKQISKLLKLSKNGDAVAENNLKEWVKCRADVDVDAYIVAREKILKGWKPQPLSLI